MTPSDSRFEPIDEQYRPVGAEKVRELEAKLKVLLPREYVAFLSRYGECGFCGDASVSVSCDSIPVFTFFGAQKLLANMDVHADLTSEGKIAFADDMSGNPFVLDAATGKIFFIDFTVNPPVGRKVAESFDTFLASITVQPFD